MVKNETSQGCRVYQYDGGKTISNDQEESPDEDDIDDS